MSNSNGIELSAHGSVIAPYDLVHFKITVSDVSADGPQAREKIDPVGKEVMSYVDKLIKEGSAFNKVISLSIDPATEYQGNKNVHVGYRASLQVTFSTDKVNQALPIQERLTRFKQSKVDSLSFGFKDISSLQEKALEDAWSSLQRRFSHSKRLVTGLGSLDYEVVTWSVDYEDRRPISKVAAPDDDTAGGAKVSVLLTVTWQKKQHD